MTTSNSNNTEKIEYESIRIYDAPPECKTCNLFWGLYHDKDNWIEWGCMKGVNLYPETKKPCENE